MSCKRRQDLRGPTVSGRQAFLILSAIILLELATLPAALADLSETVVVLLATAKLVGVGLSTLEGGGLGRALDVPVERGVLQNRRIGMLYRK